MLAKNLFRVGLADKWLVAISVTLGMFMSLMDHTIVNVAIPVMQTSFGADIASVQWVITIYMITQAVVIPTTPYLVARFGNKRTYIATLIAFLAGSVLCGFAWNLPSLIFFRFIQGIGGGILLPLVMILLYQAFSVEERGTAVSLTGIPLMVAPTLGPVLGGFLVTNVGWQWAFFINVPLGIISITLAQKVLPADRLPEHKISFDTLGFLTVAGGSASLLWSISIIGSDGALLFLVGGVLLLMTFVMVELRQARQGKTPILNLKFFGDRTFALSNLTNVLVVLARYGTLFLFPIYLQSLRGLSAEEAGGILGVLSFVTLLILPLGGRLSKRIGPQPIVLMGIVLFAGATALMATLTLDAPLWFIFIIMILVGAAFGFFPQIPVSAMSRVEKEAEQDVAHGSTLISVLQATAAPLGVAVQSSLVNLRTQSHTADLTLQGLKGDLLQRQSSLLAFHDTFQMACLLVLLSLGVMLWVPRRQKAMPQKSVSMPAYDSKS